MKFLNINYFKLSLISNVNYHLSYLTSINKRSEKNLQRVYLLKLKKIDEELLILK